MSWRDNLRPASFRGVEFHIDERGFRTGRRIHNHEYPKRDQNYPEDMGRATRRWSVDAYIVGDDYMQRRDALIRACEQPGPGQYSDFWGRSGRAVVEDCDLQEEQREGRMCRFRLTLIDAGGSSGSGAGGPAPFAIAATASLVTTAAGSLAAAALAGFASRYRS